MFRAKTSKGVRFRIRKNSRKTKHIKVKRNVRNSAKSKCNKKHVVSKRAVKVKRSKKQVIDDPWLTGWMYRKSHVINPASGAGTNYQVRIKAHYGSGTDSGEDVYLNGKCRTDFGDVRFTKSDGTTLLDYWMESKTDSDNAVFWVEVADDLSTNAVTIYIYYGKSDATTISNGFNTFLLFDDFDDNQLTNWSTSIPRGTITETEQKLVFNSNGQETDWWGGTTEYAPIAYKSMPSGSWRAKVTVSCYPTNNDRWAAGMISYLNRDNVYFLGRKNEPTTPFIFFEKIVNDVGTGNIATASYSNNVDIKLEIARIGTTEYFYYDGTLLRQQTEEFTPSYIGLFLKDWYTGFDLVAKFDNFYVRKYVSPEPSHGSWGSEESAVEERTVNVTNESVDPTSGFSGDPVTYQATVLDSSNAVLPSSFVVDLIMETGATSGNVVIDGVQVGTYSYAQSGNVYIDSEQIGTFDFSTPSGNVLVDSTVVGSFSVGQVVTLVNDQALTSDVYNPSTGVLTLGFTVPSLPPTDKTVKLSWVEQTI